MTRLLFIEVFVFGASAIAATYHFVLYLLQRDKFLLYYSFYLTSLTAYIAFKIFSNNYSPFLPNTNIGYYIIEDFLQLSMVSIYTTFAAVTLEVTQKPRLVRNFWLGFIGFSIFAFILHLIKALVYGPDYMAYFEYGLSRFIVITIATLGLGMAALFRNSTFQRIIIFGSLVYDLSGFLSAYSFTFHKDYFSYSGVEPYLIGCLFDIIIFSTALGYRLKKIDEQKNELLQKELSNQLALEKMRLNIAENLHDDVGAQLSTARMFISSMRTKARENNTSEMVENSLSLIDSSLNDLRKIMEDMHSSTLYDKGYFIATEELVNRINQLNLIKFILIYHGENLRFENRIEHQLLRITQELINNSLKYAKAQNVTIDLNVRDGKIILLYEDDGIGFDINTIKRGYGLSNIETRTNALRGTVEFDSAPGSGARTIIEIPVVYAK
ncbi:MAG: sensor histidine kinase [Bacteroidota bacterium]